MRYFESIGLRVIRVGRSPGDDVDLVADLSTGSGVESVLELLDREIQTTHLLGEPVSKLETAPFATQNSEILVQESFCRPSRVTSLSVRYKKPFSKTG